MLKVFNYTILFISVFFAGQLAHSETTKEPLPSPTGEIVVYKDRCIVTKTIKIKASDKSHKIIVPGSIDPQSILFGQGTAENPRYEITKELEKAIDAELILYTKNPFTCELTYGFTGINWHMHYVVELNESFNEILNFNGFISIDNQSGADFEDVRLRLVDGQTDNLSKNQSFNEYTINIASVLHKRRVVRVPWVSLHKQKAEQDYRFDVGGDNLLNLLGSAAKIEKQLPLQICLHFTQDLASKKDLANGDLALYVRDKGGTLRFLGINHLTATKAGECIQCVIPLHLLTQLKSNQDSPLSQIRGVLEQTEFKTLLTEKLEEAAYRLTISNFGDKEVTIKVMLPFGDNHVKVVRESNEHKQENTNSVYWQLKVSPKTEVVLRYRVQLRKE